MDLSRPLPVALLAVLAVVTVAVLVVVALVARQLTRRTRIAVGGTAAVLALGILGTGWYAWSTSSHHDTIDVNALGPGSGLTLNLKHDRLSKSGDEYDFALLRGTDADDVHDALVATGTPVDPVPGGWTLVKGGLRYSVVMRDDGTWHAENKTLTVAHGNDLTSIAFPTTADLYRADVGTPVRLPVPAAGVRAELELLGADADGPDTLVVPTNDGRTARLTFEGDLMTVEVVGAPRN
ncbi:hypothetical protein [Sanguibacter sp. HDW7]|uniref:hypothetical protein n=1 Tax=Sanguibacter sp. HDW7 TaxID=2714931 RepID=UPI001407EEE2|nr:hypothetical protein [Sanguibacter sp. HDW7]QIK83158.1 hypothetical protein G7063_05585 [Sanguibacter sp. HDW7]